MGAYALAGLVFGNFALRLLLAAVIAFIGSLFVLPLASLLMMPVTLILAWPLDLLFPLKSEVQDNQIKWCRTCRHHREVSDYEDTIKGLWHEASMPRSDKLPCKIVLETSQVWRPITKPSQNHVHCFQKIALNMRKHNKEFQQTVKKLHFLPFADFQR